jgi:maleamate amidohydrolase
MDLLSNKLGLGRKPALIVVDMTKGFTDPASPLGAECGTVKAAIVTLLDCFRDKELPVFFTAVEHPDTSEASVFQEKIPALNILQVGSDWVELDPAMARRDHEPLIKKLWASAFFGTDLAQRLRQQQVDSLVVTGLTTSGCVRATAVDGLQHNFRVVLAREATGDRNNDAHTANLFDLNAKYADVLSLEEVLVSLSTY